MANLSNINNILRTDSLGVGINRDPLGVLEVSSATRSGIKMFNTGASGRTYETYVDASGNYIIYDEDADRNDLVISDGGDATFAGNVGIGITPSASFSGLEVLQLGKGMTIFGNTNDDRATMAANLIVNTGTAFEYVMDGLAGRFSIEDGNMVWGTAPTGSAGGVATVTTRMTLLNTGNVGIGTTSPSSYDAEADDLVIYNAVTPGITIALPQTTAAGSARGSILFSDGTSGNEKYRGGIIYDHGTGMGGVADTMYIRSAINNYMVLGPTGNVGIGTKTPDARLHIYGSASLSEMYLGEDAAADKAGILKYTQGDGSGTGVITLSHWGNTSTTQSLAIEYGGDVGIGTTSPIGKTDIFVGASGYTNNITTLPVGTWSFANGSGANSYPSLVSKSNATGAGMTLVAATDDGAPNGMDFNIRKGDNTDFSTLTTSGFTFSRFGTVLQTILRNGNVGINNTSPGSKLTVNGNANGSAEYSTTLGSNASATGAANSANTSPVNKTYLTGYSIPYSGNTNARLTTCGFLEFASTSGWTGNQRIWAITSGYDIGGSDSGAGGNKMAIILGDGQNVSPQIGTNGAIGEAGDGDGANSLVACYWDNSLNMRLANSSRLYTGNGGSAALPMITPGTDKNTGIWYPTSDTWAISTAGTERMTITSAGYVHAGNTAVGNTYHEFAQKTTNAQWTLITRNTTALPYGLLLKYDTAPNNSDQYPLYFSDSVGAKFYMTSNGAVYNNGTYGTISDRKLKENIEDATPKLDDINKLKVRNFNFKDNTEEKHIGFIAQEFEEVFPKAVETKQDRDSDGKIIEDSYTKTIKTSILIPMLVKAIQELKAEIEILKNK